jgi:hypothetical protein
MIMEIIKRIKARTPRKNKTKGKVLTALGTACGVILAAGVIANPIGIAALTVGAIVFGSGAVYNAQKVQK